MRNASIREEMKLCGVCQWQIAEYLGISEATMCRKMRSELDPEFRAAVENAIRAIGSPPGLAKVRGSGLQFSIDK